MGDVKPPVSAELVWSGELQFAATSGSNAIVTDGRSEAGPSPVQLLALALLGCMSADVVDILRKGRHPMHAFHATITGTRAPEPPKRLLTAHLHFHVHGDAAQPVEIPPPHPSTLLGVTLRLSKGRSVTERCRTRW